MPLSWPPKLDRTSTFLLATLYLSSKPSDVVTYKNSPEWSNTIFLRPANVGEGEGVGDGSGLGTVNILTPELDSRAKWVPSSVASRVCSCDSPTLRRNNSAKLFVS